jgi:NAD(P)-dependent dehydrogenase (short-subunit alcohol dehydrogenase family)
MELRFDGRVVVVAGGASGIGAACARLFRACGARVVVADKNLAAAEALDAAAVALDVADEESVAAAFAAIERDFGAIEILVNSAGVLQRTLPPGELTMKEWDLVARIDLRGTYLCCAAAGTRMAARRRGSIVNLASVAGMRSGPLHAYGPAKAGVISLTECLAAEWGRAGVRVNAVSPGFTRTPALEKGIEAGVLDPESLAAASALGRLVEATEVANAVCFLASDLASGITGANLPVDLGYLAATPWQSYGGVRPPPDAERPER